MATTLEQTLDTVLKVNKITEGIALLDHTDVENMLAAKARIKEVAYARGGLDETDKETLNRIDAILRLYQLNKNHGTR